MLQDTEKGWKEALFGSIEREHEAHEEARRIRDCYLVPISQEVYEDIMRPITWWSRFKWFVFWAMPRVLWHGTTVEQVCREHGI